MSLVVFEDVSLALGGKTIVEDLGLRVAEHDRIGLIGPNGSGKSTIMRLIAGAQQPDGGKIRKRNGIRIGYLSQDVVVEGGQALLPFVRDSVPGRGTLAEELAEAEKALDAESASSDGGEASMDRMMELGTHIGELHELIDHFDTHFSEHEAKTILAGLGFTTADHERDLSEFSGGWKMRAVLASLLFQRPDLLLLDEPTNHLDMPSVAWFGSFLKRYPLAFILISHDREFLNEQITRVLSFEPEGVRSYSGDYEKYLKQRAEEAVLLEARARNLQAEREHLEQFINRFRAKASKAAQVQSRIRQLEKMPKVEVHAQRAVMNFRFPPSERTGKEILKVEGLKKAYGDHVVLEDVNLRVEPKERIALIGVNGAGKTTLLRTLAGELEPSGGSFEFGHKTKVGYYAQHHAETLPRDKTVYDAVKYCAKDASHQQIRTVLGALLFGDQEVDKKVAVLSGGERARVALAQLLIDPGNVLLMDEPTNHLDLESSERLGEALATYDGTLLFVSHNRGFIRRLATKIWFVADGKVETYPGTLDEYMASVQMRAEAPAAGAAADPSASPASQGKKAKGGEDKAKKRKEAKKRDKLGKKLKPLERRSGELEKRIAKLESEQKERSEKLSDRAVYDDPKQRDQLMTALQKTQVELDVATETWMEVQAEIESLRAEA